MDNRFPPPWSLSGRGCILLYRFSREFVETAAGVPPQLRERYSGGIGAVMLVDYGRSPVGPYGELLFIPGRFTLNGARWASITRIFVSSQDSVDAGRRNWAIPKELAPFRFETSGDGQKQILVGTDEEPIARVELDPYGPRFPLHTALLPFPLWQPDGNRVLLTRFQGKGRGRLARVTTVQTDGIRFPDVSGGRLLAAVFVDPFKVTFPEPQVVSRSG